MNCLKCSVLLFLCLFAGCSANTSNERLFDDLRKAFKEANAADDATQQMEEVDEILKELAKRDLVKSSDIDYESSDEYSAALDKLGEDGTIVYWEGAPDLKRITVHRRYEAE